MSKFLPLRFNLSLLFTDRFFASFWLINPIIVPFFQSNGLGATEIFIIEGSFSLVLLLLEVPTGYLSDVIGRRKTLLLGALLMPMGMIVYQMTSSMWGFILAEAVCALGVSLRSGTDLALLYDTLIELKEEKKNKRFDGTGHLLERLGGSTASILGGVIGLVSLRLVFAANAAVFVVLFPISLLLQEPKREAQHVKKAKEHFCDLVKALRYCASHSVIRYAALYHGLLNAVGLVGYWTYYLYYAKAGISVGYFGVMGAATAFIAGLGGKFSHAIEKKVGHAVALALPLMIACDYFLLSGMNGVYGVAPICLTAFLWGMSVPLLRDVVQRHTHTRIRATTLSLVSMIGRFGYVLLAFPIGRMIDKSSLATAHIFLGGTILCVGMFLVMALVKHSQKPAFSL